MQPKAQENMSANLITIGWNETMEAAYRRMQQFSIRHLPVYDDNSQIIGMLSDRDVQRAMVAKSHRATNFLGEEVTFAPESFVRDYMSWPVISVAPSTELVAIAHKMMHEKLSSVLVQRGNYVMGLITTDDLLAVLIDLLKEPTPKKMITIDDFLSVAGTL
jgi:acetoin utilization protein AcuB